MDNYQSQSKVIVFRIVLLLLILVPATLMSYKLFVLDYPLKGLMPVVSYQVELAMQLEGYGEDINVRTFLPRSDSRQRVLSEMNASGQFLLDQQTKNLNRLVTWKASAVEGQKNIRYIYQIQTKQLRYELPVGSLIPRKYSSEFS